MRKSQYLTWPEDLLNSYYQDLLKNWYKQEIDLIIVNSNIYSPENGGFDYVESFVVHEETQQKNKPKKNSSN